MATLKKVVKAVKKAAIKKEKIKEVEVHVPTSCLDCGGKGLINPETLCQTCKGSGMN